MVTGKYIHLSSATLATMLTNLTTAHAAALAGQSYSIAGRQLTRANLAEISNELAEVSYAQSFQSGTVKRVTYADMSNNAG